MKKSLFFLSAIAVLTVASLNSCKKDKTTTTEDPSTTTGNETKYALVIDNGAQSMEAGKAMPLTAHLVSSQGAVVSVTGVTWSSNIGGITGNVFSLNTETVGIITASVDFEGKNYKASVPVSVQSVTGLFDVVPSAIIWSTNSGDIQLNTVYIGNQSASYSFSSDNSGVASVSSSGSVSFKSVGSANIKVTANIGGQSSTIIVPVLVVGMPEVPLPVTRVVVSPALGEMFRGEELQLSAKAYNSNNEDVTSTVTFNYLVVPKLEEDEEPSSPPISVDAAGKVKALSIGDAYVKVTANGVMGQSEIVVNPDTAVMVSPFYVELGGINFMTGQPNPTNQTFTATTWKVDRTKYKAKQSNYLVQIANPSNLTWLTPVTGIPQVDQLYDLLDLTNKTNTSVTATVKTGKPSGGSTIVIADAGPYGGAAAVLVMPSGAAKSKK